jgi:hypothetical protein
MNSIRPERDDRQARIEPFLLAAHHLGMSRLHQDPERVFELLAITHRWRIQRPHAANDPYAAQWECLLNGPLAALEEAVCPDSEQAASLRACSPFGSLITAAERQRLLQEARLVRTIGSPPAPIDETKS